MPIRTVILDFDGTCTDVEREAEGFLVRYKQDLARVLGRNDLDARWEETEQAVLADPAHHGMVIGGLLVAPPVDPYLLATAISAALEPNLGDAETEPAQQAGTARFDGVPPTLTIAGWERPVFPRRGHYFDALESIWQATGTAPEETLVVGDVFELDLVLPATLGSQVHLATGPRTLPYEREATSAFGGTHGDDLRELLALLD